MFRNYLPQSTTVMGALMRHDNCGVYFAGSVITKAVRYVVKKIVLLPYTLLQKVLSSKVQGQSSSPGSSQPWYAAAPFEM